MYCGYCGEKLEDRTPFCTHCGAATGAASAQTAAPVTPVQDAPGRQPKAPAPQPVVQASGAADETALKEMKAYLQTSLIPAFIGIIIALFGLVSVISLGQIVASIIIVVFGAILIYSSLGSRKTMEKCMEELTASGELHAVLQDFSAATSLVNDKIRLGNTYVFGKKKDVVVRYTDIRKLYQSIKKKNFVENSRTLDYVGADGKTHTLCDLLLKGKSDEDMAKIMMVVKSKNPGVHLGYK